MWKSVINEHDWLLNDNKIANIPLPTKNNTTFNQPLVKAVPPTRTKDINQLQSDMGFNYRQAIGELIFLMVTCRPDVSYPLIKLSQYSNEPAQEHYEFCKHIFKYVKATKMDGINFWHKNPRNDIPDLPLSQPLTNSHTLLTLIHNAISHI